MGRMTDAGSPATALVSGASGALGGAVTDAFLAAGLHVLGLDLVPAPRPGRPSYRHVLVDLRDEGAVESALRDGLDALPPLTHVASVAGGALPGEPAAAAADDLGSIDGDLFRRSIDANLTSQWLLTRGALRYLGDRVDIDRSITLTSSLNGLSAWGMPAYSAAKAGVHGLMYGLVDPLGRRGIRVNVVAPGTARTPRTEALWAGSPGHFERLEAGTAVGRLATSAEVAEVYLALALRLRHVTGQILIVDGGQSVIHRSPAG